jgi:membrane protein
MRSAASDLKAASKGWARRFDHGTPKGVRSLVHMLAFLFGRDGTVLISSIAFSFFVSVFPVIFLLLSLANFLDLPNLRESIFEAIRNFFPISQDFIVRNLRIYTQQVGTLHLVSALLIAWAGSTFFFALEAGLDSAFRVPKYRHFVHSQFLGSAMTILSGILVFQAIAVFGFYHGFTGDWLTRDSLVLSLMDLLVSFALVLVLFFTLYYFLPNRPRKAGKSLIESVLATVVWLILNELFREAAQHWQLQRIYGPFYVSMTLLLWAYASGCVLLGCARLSADGLFSSRTQDLQEEEEEDSARSRS